MTISLRKKQSRLRSRASRQSALQQNRYAGLEKLEDRIVFNTYWASNLDDSGEGSLRDAIESANFHAGADDIRFREEMKGTITLSSELSITDSLTIHGRGSDKLTVSGGGTTRVVNIAAGADVTIEHLTIAHGFVSGADGAGILNQGNLRLLDSVVSGNSAQLLSGPNGGGGGIKSLGNLTIQRSQITGNSATLQGGGIWNLGIVTIHDSQIDNNTGRIFGGGGLMNSGSGNMILDHVDVTNNRGPEGAGINSGFGFDRVINNSTTLTIDHSTISDNHGTGGVAGLIFSSDRDMTIRDSKFKGNTGQAAVTIYQASGDVLISRSEITENVGTYFGGLWSSTQGNTRIEDTTISNNVGAGAGGIAQFGSSPFEIVRSTISGNTAIPNGWSIGAGGIWGNPQLVDSTISGNTVVADNAYLSPYFPSGFAGGMLAGYTAGDNASVDNSTIANNRVVNAPVGSQSAGGLLGLNWVFDFYYYPGGTHYYGNYPANVPVRNTIIAKNENLGGDADVSGSFVSQGHNLIGILGASATGFVASDLQGTSDAPLDPLLGPLARNGGLTKTHMLRRGSPAIDAGDNSNAPESDQRGYVRIVGDAIDIGSVERGSHRLKHMELPDERQVQQAPAAELRTGISAVQSGPTSRASSASPRQMIAALIGSSSDRLHDDSLLLTDPNDPKLQLGVVDDVFASLTAEGF